MQFYSTFSWMDQTILILRKHPAFLMTKPKCWVRDQDPLRLAWVSKTGLQGVPQSGALIHPHFWTPRLNNHMKSGDYWEWSVLATPSQQPISSSQRRGCANCMKVQRGCSSLLLNNAPLFGFDPLSHQLVWPLTARIHTSCFSSNFHPSIVSTWWIYLFSTAFQGSNMWVQVSIGTCRDLYVL